MILAIDTSSSIATVAVIDEDSGRRESISGPAKEADFRAAMHGLARAHRITKVAVATGPGSFTGLRVGVAFGLGLAIGLRVPIVPLPTLDLQAARSDEPVTAVVDAGRGRFYYLVPGAKPALGEAVDIPTSHWLVGQVPGREPALIAAGHRIKPEKELRPLVDAMAKMLETASEVPYGSLEIKYMQSFSPARA
jgi:tRNA threonylcarbamoyladenosine biosynthesis protein TsaB